MYNRTWLSCKGITNNFFFCILEKKKKDLFVEVGYYKVLRNNSNTRLTKTKNSWSVWLCSLVIQQLFTHLRLIFVGAFDLLVYTDKDLEVPDSWDEDGPQLIANSEEVRLRSFTTLLHKVDAMVAYKKTDWKKKTKLFVSCKIQDEKSQVNLDQVIVVRHDGRLQIHCSQYA